MKHHGTLKRSSLVTVVALLAAGAANGQQTTLRISPPSPTIHDHVTLVLKGVWSDSCTPGRAASAKVVREDGFLDVIFNYNDLNVACATVLTPYEAEVPLGQLAAGSYTVDVAALHSLIPPTAIGTITFTVTPPEESTFYVPGFRSADGVLASYFSAYNNSPNQVEVRAVAAFDAGGRRDLSLPPLSLVSGASGQLDTQSLPEGSGVQMIAVRAQSRVAFRPALERFTAPATATGSRASLGRLPLPIFKGLFPAGSRAVAGDVKLFGDGGCEASARRVNLTLFNGGAKDASFAVTVRAVGVVTGGPIYTQEIAVPAESTIQINDLPLLTPAVCSAGIQSVWFEVSADQPSASYVSSTVLNPVPTAIPYEIYSSRLEY